jgi:hypothetical protein
MYRDDKFQLVSSNVIRLLFYTVRKPHAGKILSGLYVKISYGFT